MKKSIAVVAGLLLTHSALAFEAADVDLPVLAHGLENASGNGCNVIRAKTPAELAPPWRDQVIDIETACEPMAGIDDEPDARVDAIARLRLGTVTFLGVGVVELRESSSWAHNDNQYVLDAPYATIVGPLSEHIRKRCLAESPAQALPDTTCTIDPEGMHNGIFVRTSELGGTWLHPDASNPRRSILAQAWSD